MEKICDIQRNNRTVWTIAIHPNDPSLVATGNMGGIASVFKDLVSIYLTSSRLKGRNVKETLFPTLATLRNGR